MTWPQLNNLNDELTSANSTGCLKSSFFYPNLFYAFKNVVSSSIWLIASIVSAFIYSFYFCSDFYMNFIAAMPLSLFFLSEFYDACGFEKSIFITPSS